MKPVFFLTVFLYHETMHMCIVHFIMGIGSENFDFNHRKILQRRF
jgi:hypothetical protein